MMFQDNLTIQKEININESKSIISDLKLLIKKDYIFFITVFIAVILIHLLLWKAFPFHLGPDGIIFLNYFVDMFNKNPLFPMIQTYRTPVAPIFYGLLLKFGGITLTSIICELLSLSCIPMIYLIGYSWGKISARIITIIFIIMLPFQIQFHQLSSDALFSWSIIFFFLIFIYAIENLKLKYWIYLGIITAFLILVRPSGIIFALAVLSLLLIKINWRKTLKLAAMYLLILCFILSSFIIYKGIRFKDFSLSRGSNYMEFMRIYTLQEPLLDPNNGPYSKKLVDLVNENLINSDFYKKYNITLEKFLKYRPNRRFFGDIIVLVDRTQGWDSEYELLRKVAIESILANPLSYFKNLLKDIISLSIAEQKIQEVVNVNSLENNLTVNLIKDENIYEKPTENELIPYSKIWWNLSRPDGKIPEKKEFESFDLKLKPLLSKLENQKSNIIEYSISKYFWEKFSIPFWIFWIFGIIGIFLNNGSKRIILIAIIVLSFLLIAGTLYSQPAYLRYRLPLDPLITFAGIIGFLSLFNKKNLIDYTQ